MKKIILFLTAASLVGCSVPQNQYNKNLYPNVKYRDSIDMSRGEVELISIEVTDFLKENSEEVTVDKAKTTVANLLKDPESAQFRNVKLVEYKGRPRFTNGAVVSPKEGYVVCGEINGKNSYGGYVGFKSFVAGVSQAQIERSGGRNETMNAQLNTGLFEACR